MLAIDDHMTTTSIKILEINKVTSSVYNHWLTIILIVINDNIKR